MQPNMFFFFSEGRPSFQVLLELLLQLSIGMLPFGYFLFGVLNSTVECKPLTHLFVLIVEGKMSSF